MVRTNTVDGPGHSDGGVIRIKGSKRGLAASTDCNGRYVYLNPRKGGQIAVAEAARNVVCSGAKPVAITNCLNFGNPYKPEMYWVFKEALGGMGDACRVLNTPVTGGNVSFYNENPKGAVFPTPTIGMLGILEDVDAHHCTPAFKKEGDVVLYVGADRKGLGGSEYLSFVHGKTTGDAPEIDLDFEQRLQASLLEAIQEGMVASAHDCSDGGLVVALIEKAMFGEFGAKLSVDVLGGATVETLFSEAQSGVVLSCSPEHVESLMAHFHEADVPAYQLGHVQQGDALLINALSFSVAALTGSYESVITKAMSKS
jgi:phosphoribosylformylglycinamidine synthase